MASLEVPKDDWHRNVDWFQPQIPAEACQYSCICFTHYSCLLPKYPNRTWIGADVFDEGCRETMYRSGIPGDIDTQLARDRAMQCISFHVSLRIRENSSYHRRQQ